MPRIKPNTITKTPWSFTQGGSARRLPLIRLATESQARSVQPLIDRERGIRQANVAGAEAKARGFDNAMKTVAGAARLAGDMADRAIRMRNETFVAKKAAEYQRAVTLWETGIDEQGRHVGSLFETPYDPGDENGEGMSGATVEIAKAHAQWFEDQQMTPEQAEMVAKHIEPLRGRLFAAARRVDWQNHERNRVEAFASLSRSQADNYYKTGDAASLSEAALTFALSQTPRSQIANFEEWQEGGSRDPAQIQFATPAGKTAFDEAYTKANDGIQEKHVNNLLDEAVNTEDEEVAQKLFAMFDASVDNESDVAEFFIKEESQEELRKKLRVAKERRKAVVAGRDRDRNQMARRLSTRVILEQASEEEIKLLDELRAKMPPEDILALDGFTNGVAEKLEYGKWEDFSFKKTENGIPADPKARKALEKELKDFALTLKHPKARAQAFSEASRLVTVSVRAGSASAVSDRSLELRRRFGGQEPSVQLKEVHDLAEAGTLSAEKFVKHVDDIRKVAEDGIDPVGLTQAMVRAGFDIDGYFERDEAGAIRFGADGRPKMSKRGKAGKKRKQSAWHKDYGIGWFDLEEHYKVGEDFMLAVYDLAREYRAQERSGVKPVDTLEAYLKKNVWETSAGKNLTDEKLMDSIRARHDQLKSEYEKAVGNYYFSLIDNGGDEDQEEYDEKEGADDADY